MTKTEETARLIQFQHTHLRVCIQRGASVAAGMWAKQMAKAAFYARPSLRREAGK